MTDSEDPILASYDVYLTQPSTASKVPSIETSSPSPKALVLQYPAYRPSSRPYNAARAQKPQELRLKPNTGLLEVDIPILTQENYNEDTGARYGKALSDSKTLHGSSSHGLAGGFYSGSSQAASLRDVPSHDDALTHQPGLRTQTLGGKIVEHSEKEPIYFLASMQNNSIQLSHLDAVVQMRPQLHHLDAEEELNQKRFQVGSAGSGLKGKTTAEPGASKVESRAIEIKLKDNKDDGRDRTLNENARNLRDIQIDTWQSHTWADQDEAGAQAVRNRLETFKNADNFTGTSHLKSSMSNGDWLDKMSAPREDGKKGLLAKLRGRERERARRKKAEEEKRLKAKASGVAPNPGTGPLMDQSSDSDASSQDATDVEMEHGGENEGIAGHEEVDVVEIKEEPTPGLGTDTSMGPASSTRTGKKRGRPKKVDQATPIEVDD